MNEGEWLDDKRNGSGSLYDPDGLVIATGKWIDDVSNIDE